MRSVVHGYAALAAALCVAGFLLGGGMLVTALVVAGLAVLTWRVAAASLPRAGWRGAVAGRPSRRPAVPFAQVRPASAMCIRHQRDADVMHDERRKREGVEDLMEAEPPR